MRSSSSPAVRQGAPVEASFASWTPELVVAGTLGTTDRSIGRRSADVAAREALAEAEQVARLREEELARQAAAEREKAVEEAYQEGFADGERAEAARLRTVTQAVTEALEVLRDGEVRWTGTIEENVCALATVIARQVLGRELKLDIEPVATLVRSALDEFPIDQPIRIRLNPSDLTALASVSAGDVDPLKAITKDREARWLSDATIAPGGCMVEGREKIIDGRIDTALERIYRRLTYTNA
jgi:flagellar assembly protein FliH